MNSPTPIFERARRKRALVSPFVPMTLLCLVSAAGCGHGTGNVSGTVTFKEQIVPDGTVTLCMGAQVFEADIRDGAYEFTKVPLGDAKITVVRLDPKQADPYAALAKARKLMSEKKIADPKEVDPAVVTDRAQLDALQKKRHLLPLAYSALETSGLTCTVSAGQNVVDIPLKDAP